MGSAAAVRAAAHGSAEVRLRRIRALIEVGDLAAANTELVALATDEPGDWRVDYCGGLAALAAAAAHPEQLQLARTAFDEVYSLLPGEPAPRLALAACAELAGDLATAARYYRSVWRTDHSFVSAAFGLARVYLRRERAAEAITVLESVPATSSHHLAAQVVAVLADTRGAPADGQLLRAGERLGALDLDAGRSSYLAVAVLSAALAWVQSTGSANSAGGRLLGCGLTERELRLGLERRYRALARLADRLDDRIALVDQANAVRPRTLV